MDQNPEVEKKKWTDQKKSESDTWTHENVQTFNQRNAN